MSHRFTESVAAVAGSVLRPVPGPASRARHRCAPAPVALALLAVLGCEHDPAAPVAVGTLERDRLELIAETDDPIVEVAAREGDDLAAGQLVLRLDDTRLNAAAEGARAQRDQAAARLAELVRGPRAERIVEARARLAGDDTTLAVAERELERVSDLFQSGVVPEEQVDQRRQQRDAARAQRDADHAALDALLNGTTREELDQARSAVATAEAALVDAELRRSRLQVTAPVAGRLDALPYEQGERPRAGSTVAVLLAGGSPYARVYVPEPLFTAARQGAGASIRVDGDDRVHRGRVRRLSAQAAFTPHFALTERDRSRLSYLAEIELTDPGARDLPTGVPVVATFPEAGAETAGTDVESSSRDRAPSSDATASDAGDGVAGPAATTGSDHAG